MFYAYYDKVSGDLVSTGTIPAATTPATLIRQEYATDPSIGFTWDTSTKAFSTAHRVSKTVTKIEYLLRFTQTERRSLRRKAKTDEVLDDLLFLTQQADFIDIYASTTQAGLAYLVSVGVLTTTRRQEIEDA